MVQPKTQLSMKKLRSLIIVSASIVILLTIGWAYIGSMPEERFLPSSDTVQVSGKQYTCPMHPEVVSDSPGDCPECGMHLVEKADGNVSEGKSSPTFFRKLHFLLSGNNKSQASDVEDVYVCPMHPEIVRDKPGDCPECGMHLVLKSKMNETSADLNPKPIAGTRNKSRKKIVASGDLSSPKQYVCSMHPQIVRDAPGDCPICGMFLIEKISRDNNLSDSTLNDVVANVNNSVLAKVATTSPVFVSLPVIIEANGVVTCDPRKIKSVSASYEGAIEKSFIKYQFQKIRQNQKIYQIYCPDIYIKEWNYVLIMQNYPDNPRLNHEAYQWFKLLGLTDGQIDSLKKAKKPDYHLNVYSEAGGYVVGVDFNPDVYFSSSQYKVNSPLSDDSRFGLKEGIIVQKGQELFKIIDPQYLRIDLKVRTENINVLKPGQLVTVTDDYDHGNEYKGTVNQVEPMNGSFFQIVQVYVKDSKQELMPGRIINGNIRAENHEAFWIPKSSVVVKGSESVVFLFDGGKFISKNIKTGLKIADWLEVVSGLDTDSKIALNGMLLVDSDGFISAND